MDRIFKVLIALSIYDFGTSEVRRVDAPKEIEEFFMELDKPTPVTDVSGVLWREVSLPCNITPYHKDDFVLTVLWFKNMESEPIYSFDVRNRGINGAKVWSSPTAFGSRPIFNASSQPAALHIRNVQLEDEAMYRCRVDFKNSPTRNSKINFTVIVLPSRPVIYDSYRREIETLLEQCNEGSTLSLTCQVSGGRPQPEVRWYLENKLIDNTYQRLSSSLIINQLNDLKLTREHLNAQLTCEANNTLLAEPSTRLVILNINLKPLKVEILQKMRPLSVDREYEIECLASGSRPPAQITWFVGENPIKHLALKFPNADNQVISIMKYSPKIDDHGKQIICRAENPSIKNSAIEDKWNLNIQYCPQVTLKMGHSLDPRSIKEGDDVYFECDIKCNPKAFKQAWKHNGEEIHQNVTAGIILTDRSLVLQKVTKYASGSYTCMAANIEGKGISNSVTLEVMFVPSCKIRREQLYGALKQETVLLECEVESNPKPSAFHWTFNNSGDSSLVSPSRYTHSGYTSIIKYTPVTDLDYGTLACWAKNTIGHQKKPCIYRVVAAGRPLPLINCSITNQTENSLEVRCMENFNGGLPQYFLMELFELPNMKSKFNTSVSGRPPSFYVQGVDSAASYKVKLFAANAKGVSDPVYLEIGSFNGAAKYTGVGRSLQIVTVTTGSIFIFSLLVVSFCVLGTSVIFYRHRQKCKEHSRLETSRMCNETKDQAYVSAIFVTDQKSTADPKRPDIITNTCGNRVVNEFTNIPLAKVNDNRILEECRDINFARKISIDSCDHRRGEELQLPRPLPFDKPPTDICEAYKIDQCANTATVSRESRKRDTFVIQSSRHKQRLSPEVVTACTKLQESCI